MARIKARADHLKAKAQETMRLRTSPEYLQAMEALGRDLGDDDLVGGDSMDDLRVEMTPGAVEALRSCD